jgi:hypothetical protein
LRSLLGTVWRVIRYGELVGRKEDLQVKETSGRRASLITIIGLLGVHWLSLFCHSPRGKTNVQLELQPK